jgi:glutamate synthase domain-containing protein 1
MCGIMGYIDKTGTHTPQLGAIMLKMLAALGRRGPDSAGIAYYASHKTGDYLARIKLGDRATYSDRAAVVLDRVSDIATVCGQERDAEYLRLVLDDVGNPQQLQAAIESLDPDIEIISLGRSLEIVKQVGSPHDLEDRFHISRIQGTHAIAHTRLSTESRVDLSHSQPFWAHGSPDVSSVHNGHITNYHKLRRQYEECNVRFYTENDSEIIGIFLTEMLGVGATLWEAMDVSQRVFDGSFCYLAATQDEIGFAKDRFGLKPLVVMETDEFVAVATEEVALRQPFGETPITWEPPPGLVRTWRAHHRSFTGARGSGASHVSSAAGDAIWSKHENR